MLRRNIIIYSSCRQDLRTPQRALDRQGVRIPDPGILLRIEAMARKRSWETSPEEVIRETMG